MSARLYDIISQVMAVPISQINDKSSDETIESWDSFSVLLLLNEVETAFKIKFTLDEIINTKTVNDIKRNLHNHGILLDK
jgi:acyl carrier protein